MRSIRILLGALFALTATVSAAADDLPCEDIDKLVNSKLQDLENLDHADASKAPGIAVAVVRGKDSCPPKGYGKANVELNVDATDETIFQSGSLGKQFVAALVMLLVQEKKMTFDDPITKYLHGAPPWWGSITIEHLLTHTSGLPNYNDDVSFDYRHDYSEDELQQNAYLLKPQFEPGAAWCYSNTGYMLLGIIIHKVTGHFYGAELRDRIFHKLEMETARVIWEADIIKNRAAGYWVDDGYLENQVWVAPETNTTADGSLYFSINDLIKWEGAVWNESLLSRDSWKKIFTPVRLNDGRTYPYGFGWYIDDVAEQRVFSHDGVWQGFSGAIVEFGGSGLRAMVLSNQRDFPAVALAWDIGKMIDGRLAADIPRHPCWLPLKKPRKPLVHKRR